MIKQAELTKVIVAQFPSEGDAKGTGRRALGVVEVQMGADDWLWALRDLEKQSIPLLSWV